MLTRPSLVPAPPGITKGLFFSGRLFTLQNLQGLLYRIHQHPVCALIAKQPAVQPDHPNNLWCKMAAVLRLQRCPWSYLALSSQHAVDSGSLDPRQGLGISILRWCIACYRKTWTLWIWKYAMQNSVVGVGGGLKTDCHSRPSPPLTSPLKALGKSHLIVSQPCLKIGFKYCTKCLIRNVSLRTDPLKRTVPYNSWLEIE